MDPMTAAFLATAIAPLVSGAAGEAGKQAWQSLADHARGVFHRDSAPVRQISALPAQPEPAQVHAVAEALADRAADDPAFAQWLRQWLNTEARPASSDVTNTVTGTVGTAIMGRDLSGGITIGIDRPDTE